MGVLSGERTVEVEAAIAACFAIAADAERAPDWQPALRDVEVRERDGDRRASLAECDFDAKVRGLRCLLRFTYAEPKAIDFVQERGDVKALRGRWSLEALGGDRTRVTYGLEVDPGRMLGLLLRGPAEASVREHLLRAADALKAQAEGP
jgi:ribosome-associated toxin RatA of RatAB toxin-antitoxin module